MGLQGLRGLAVAWTLGASIVVTALPIEAADGFAYGVCQVARPSIGAAVRPITDAGSYLFEYFGKDPRYKDFSFEDAKVTMVKAPKHGKVVFNDDPLAVSSSWYDYRPNKGFRGQDRFVMDVEKNAVKVRIHYLIQAIPDEVNESGYCSPEHWKISTTSDQPLPGKLLTRFATAG